jgi:hypothetical protein
MMKLCSTLIIILLFFLGSLSPYTPQVYARTQKIASKAGQIIVKFKPTIPQATIQKKFKSYNMHVIHTFDELSALVVQVPIGQEETIINNLIKENLVLYADHNFLYIYDAVH